MIPQINHISTALPAVRYEQRRIMEWMKKNVAPERAVASIIHRIYTQSGIRHRHTFWTDFLEEGAKEKALFWDGVSKKTPLTGTRNAVYKKYCPALFFEAARRIFEEQTAIRKEDVTHIITVSCTGFYAPGPDFELLEQLGLHQKIQRFHIGFMGCFAAFPALKMAEAFCKANPQAVVLIVCAELCSLHFQFKTDIDSLISSSVFSDGAAAAIVSCQKPGLAIETLEGNAAPNSKNDMAWIIGNTGFDMKLSTYVPDIIKDNISGALNPILSESGLDFRKIKQLALHPGGRAIIDKVQASLPLPPETLQCSRNVLQNFGNMSSPTILFVLKEVIAMNLPQGTMIPALAFGPGLTIETGLFRISN